MITLYVRSFRLPHDQEASSNPHFTVLKAKKGTLVWGITDGRGHWFRHCWLEESRAQECLTNWGDVTPQSVAVNVCTDTTYAILTA